MSANIVNIREASGATLNWLVAYAENKKFNDNRVIKVCRLEETLPAWIEVENRVDSGYFHRYDPSRDAAQAWEIIEREGIDLHQIKSRPYGIFDYNKNNLDLLSNPGASVICHDSLIGPTRRIRVPNKGKTNEGKWLARMSIEHNPFGWRRENCLSDTGLMAAMRCWVISVLGDSVEVPDSLVEKA
jgi:hypothetical protein